VFTNNRILSQQSCSKFVTVLPATALRSTSAAVTHGRTAPSLQSSRLSAQVTCNSLAAGGHGSLPGRNYGNRTGTRLPVSQSPVAS